MQIRAIGHSALAWSASMQGARSLLSNCLHAWFHSQCRLQVPHMHWNNAVSGGTPSPHRDGAERISVRTSTAHSALILLAMLSTWHCHWVGRQMENGWAEVMHGRKLSVASLTRAPSMLVDIVTYCNRLSHRTGSHFASSAALSNRLHRLTNRCENCPPQRRPLRPRPSTLAGRSPMPAMQDPLDVHHNMYRVSSHVARLARLAWRQSHAPKRSLRQDVSTALESAMPDLKKYFVTVKNQLYRDCEVGGTKYQAMHCQNCARGISCTAQYLALSVPDPTTAQCARPTILSIADRCPALAVRGKVRNSAARRSGHVKTHQLPVQA
jgi:hypothetical protein